MKLITRQILANEAAEGWMQQYPKDKDGIGAKLNAMGNAPDPDAIDAVIGNEMWTRIPDCDECGAQGVPVVQVGEEPDRESNTANLCKSCLSAALIATNFKEPKMNDILTKDEIRSLKDLNQDAIKLYLESAEARLADTLDTKKQLEQKVFILFGVYIAAALAFFWFAEESPSIDFWPYLTAFAFCAGVIPLFISMKSSVYGNLGRHPIDWFENDAYLTIKEEHVGYVYAYMLYDYMPRIDISKKANERKAFYLNIAVLLGMASLLPFTAKALFSL